MSKANQKFVQADEAVSPVIGVILMVAITVVLAAVVFVLVSNLSGDQQDTVNASLQAEADSSTDRINIRHTSGDTLEDGVYEVSIVVNGNAPQYIACTGDFAPGDILVASTVTADATTPAVACSLTTGTIASGDAFTAGQTEYHVLVRDLNSQTLVLDVVVTGNLA